MKKTLLLSVVLVFCAALSFADDDERLDNLMNDARSNLRMRRQTNTQTTQNETSTGTANSTGTTTYRVNETTTTTTTTETTVTSGGGNSIDGKDNGSRHKDSDSGGGRMANGSTLYGGLSFQGTTLKSNLAALYGADAMLVLWHWLMLGVSAYGTVPPIRMLSSPLSYYNTGYVFCNVGVSLFHSWFFHVNLYLMSGIGVDSDMFLQGSSYINASSMNNILFVSQPVIEAEIYLFKLFSIAAGTGYRTAVDQYGTVDATRSGMATYLNVNIIVF